MKRLLALPVLLALALVVAAPASAATPNAVLKAQLRAQKAKVAKLTKQLATAKTTITTLKGQVVTLTGTFATAQTDLATRTTERDAALATVASVQVQLAAAQQGGLAAVLTQTPDGLWESMHQIWLVMPNSSLCGYSKTVYSSGNYTSYDFVRYLC